ncbi:hypothetical protein E2C01_034969 [Portunus trituberculatus]|uniref:Uncharacterized protein n=1 Tax=Portunus trituberculatus TaxID=210409 RepID=A0A5B7F1Y3_PORTR|nr:hypothetical protein [Portunus trituberculatus]
MTRLLNANKAVKEGNGRCQATCSTGARPIYTPDITTTTTTITTVAFTENRKYQKSPSTPTHSSTHVISTPSHTHLRPPRPVQTHTHLHTQYSSVCQRAKRSQGDLGCPGTVTIPSLLPSSPPLFKLKEQILVCAAGSPAPGEARYFLPSSTHHCYSLVLS